jgi:hypothetical protein
VIIARILWRRQHFFGADFRQGGSKVLPSRLIPMGGSKVLPSRLIPMGGRHDAVVVTIEEAGLTEITVLVWNR